MPEIIVELAEGRTIDQKRQIVREITDTIVRAGLLSYQVLYFGHNGAAFQPPEEPPPHPMTVDLPRSSRPR